MCQPPDNAIKSEADDLRERAEQCIDHGSRYACRPWHEHLTCIDEHMAHSTGITSALRCFLEKKFLSWLEVFSIPGAVRVAADALHVAAERLEVN